MSDEALAELKNIKAFVEAHEIDREYLLDYIDERIKRRIDMEPTEEDMYWEEEGHTFSRETGKCVDKKDKTVCERDEKYT